jgi:hypothetical protein
MHTSAGFYMTHSWPMETILLPICLEHGKLIEEILPSSGTSSRRDCPFCPENSSNLRRKDPQQTQDLVRNFP